MHMHMHAVANVRENANSHLRAHTLDAHSCTLFWRYRWLLHGPAVLCVYLPVCLCVFVGV